VSDRLVRRVARIVLHHSREHDVEYVDGEAVRLIAASGSDDPEAIGDALDRAVEADLLQRDGDRDRYAVVGDPGPKALVALFGDKEGEA
jgi:hypothetical protein